MSDQIAILSFYSFVDIQEPEILISKILYIGKRKCLRGTILVAKEGFNGSISGSKENVDFLLHSIIKLTEASDVNIKVNYSDAHPFNKLKVKLKSEIISMGIKDLKVAGHVGQYIDPRDWDEFISRDDVVLVDTRNDYEVDVGTFANAVNPLTKTFKDFPKWALSNKHIFENKKIAMCCTGGVRCEKSTAYMKSIGYDDVFHLKGGILQYLEDTGNNQNKWHGECFVFDERGAVDNNLSPSKQQIKL